jgi:MoaA/NifB/PqqE/SkfB family radical SAM enzyme
MAALTSLPMLYVPAESESQPLPSEDTMGWLTHSRSRYFLRRGGNKLPPPLAATLAITDLGSPSSSGRGERSEGIRPKPANRRHMDFHLFQQAADTLFPLLRLIEFKGRGDPTLHPSILDMLETVADYEPYFRLFTWGTHLSDAVVRQVAKMHGELVIIQPGDEAFHSVGNQIQASLRLLRTLRDPGRLSVRLAVPLTEQTAPAAEQMVPWAQQAGFDVLDFHPPHPLYANQGNSPAPDRIQGLRQALADAEVSIEIRLHGEIVKPGLLSLPAEPIPHRNVPCRPDQSGGHSHMACMAPRQMVHIDLDGCICGCDRLEFRKLGNALTVEAFADCWFGQEYKAFRDRMDRKQIAFYETCRGCITQHSAA